MVRGLRVPGRPFALGAVARDGLRVLNETLVRTLLVPEKALDEAARREAKEIARRERLYRGRRAYPELRGRTVLLVDDGSASPATVRAATRALLEVAARQRDAPADRAMAGGRT
jgi:predicted phosphoribosyltransferase